MDEEQRRERRERHWHLVEVEGMSANAAGQVTGCTRSTVRGDLNYVRGLDKYAPSPPATIQQPKTARARNRPRSKSHRRNRPLPHFLARSGMCE
jgi:transposase